MHIIGNVVLILAALLAYSTAPAQAQKITLGIKNNTISIVTFGPGCVFLPVELTETIPLKNYDGFVSISEPGYDFQTYACDDSEIIALVSETNPATIAVRADTMIGVVMQMKGTIVKVQDERTMYVSTDEVARSSQKTYGEKRYNLTVVSADQLYYETRYAYRSLYSYLDGHHANIRILYIGHGNAVLLEPPQILEQSP